MNCESLLPWERLPPSEKQSHNQFITLNPTKEANNVYLELCPSQQTMRRMNYQKSRRLFVSVDWHEREPGFPRTASSCALFAVSERSGGRWSFYGNKQKIKVSRRRKKGRFFSSVSISSASSVSNSSVSSVCNSKKCKHKRITWIINK